MNRQELVLAAILVVMAAYMIAPFSDAIIFGVVTAYGLNVLMERLEQVMDRRLAGGLVVFAIFSIVFGSIYLIIANTSYVVTEIFRFVENFSANITAFLDLYNMEALGQQVESVMDNAAGYIQVQILSFASGVPKMLLNLFVYCIVVFYAYMDGPRIYNGINSLIGRMPSKDARTVKKIRDNVIGLVENVFIVYGTVAIILGIISEIGFYFIGLFTLGHPLPFHWFWAILVAIAAFLRGIASGVFLGPMVGYYFLVGEVWFAFWLGLFSIVFLWLFPETVLTPYLGASRMEESYITVVLGFTAGIIVFGLQGMIIGPVIIITLRRMLAERIDSFGGQPVT